MQLKSHSVAFFVSFTFSCICRFPYNLIQFILQVVIPLHQVKAVNPSTSNTINGVEKYIQVVSVDNHEFWYMGFLYYDEAVKCLQDSVEIRHLESV